MSFVEQHHHHWSTDPSRTTLNALNPPDIELVDCLPIKRPSSTSACKAEKGPSSGRNTSQRLKEFGAVTANEHTERCQTWAEIKAGKACWDPTLSFQCQSLPFSFSLHFSIHLCQHHFPNVTERDVFVDTALRSI
ncbi:hypothetical protein KIN20_004327 [Parelaphostrongylus tenuis]|uniref:Uncharacterized protein n=1 Tax=Parelaphostrongylus tenuis TaxID=148309 RepID=A0AAD5M2X7_PARTN|nr:hypothetical protein KIN20_004327 [Parelaphostrongylus tenuis]